MLYRSTAPRVRTFSQVLNFRNDMERLESRVFFDAGYTMDPDLVASLNSPRQRNPGAGISVDASSDPGTNAPPVLGTIEGVNFNGDATASGFYHIPPDIIGTAGPNHVLNAVNTTIQWFTKAGTNQLTQRLGKNGSTAVGSFFASLAPVDGLFDPKVLYDQYSNRFVVVALEMQDTAVGDPINSSRLLIAASDDSDPNGTWYFQAIDTKLNIAGTDTWLDYPGLAVDSGAMYITGNMFNFGASTFRGSRLWLLDKAGLYAGGTSAFNMYDPSTLAGGIPGGQVFTPQPAHMFGSAPGTVGTFLVSSGFAFGSNEAISVIRIDNPLSSPTFTGTFIDVGNISSTYNPPTSSQLGTAQTVDSGDARVMNAVWRNNFLYFGNIVSPVAGADTGTATAHWYKFNATNVTTSLADQGNIGAEDIAAGTRTYYPAVAVDSANNLAIGFAASGPSIYPGAYYTGRLAGDAAGTVQTTGTLAAGLDFYNRRFGGSRNRWGDYSGLALDPADGSTFWVYNQYALARGNIFGAYPTEDGRWGTRWGKFSLAALSGGINGIVYEDRDGSSTYGGSDTVMLGVTVYLDANNNGSLDGGESSTTSTGTGYSFTGLAPGSYNVREVVPAGYILTEPVSGIHVLVVAAATLSANFGNFPYVFTGTAGNDSYYVRASGGNAQIWVGAVPPTTPTYSIAKSML
ncbi:MAG: hypothetical protein H7144_16385, partial [Burkholderiales bacterium]|nr:hypothetical protein [Phycisphaerae bacterium]